MRIAKAKMAYLASTAYANVPAFFLELSRVRCLYFQRRRDVPKSMGLVDFGSCNFAGRAEGTTIIHGGLGGDKREREVPVDEMAGTSTSGSSPYWNGFSHPFPSSIIPSAAPPPNGSRTSIHSTSLCGYSPGGSRSFFLFDALCFD